MAEFRQEIFSGAGVLRVDVIEKEPGREQILDEMTFLNYRLAEVQFRSEIKKSRPDVIWNREKDTKAIRYDDGQLFLDGEWEQGELNKIMVAMLAYQMDAVGLHPWHSSAVRFKDRTILFLGGENNHGKSMGQIEGCRRGGQVVSTETTVTDDDGIVVAGSKSVYIRVRAKGTERADLPSQDEGVAKFFEKEPEFINYNEPTPVDLVIMPGMDGHFDTKVVKMGDFEKEYQSYHSVMNYFGLNQLLSPGGLVMPVVDTDEKRAARGDFIHRFVQDKPYYMVRAATPRLMWDEVEKILAKENLV